VPYKGAAPAIADVLGNQIQLNASAKSVLLPLINAGKLRPLVVTSAERWPELPQRADAARAGFRQLSDTLLVYADGTGGKTPPDVVTKLNAAADAGIAKHPRRKTLSPSSVCSRKALQARRRLPRSWPKEVPLWKRFADEAGVASGVTRQ